MGFASPWEKGLFLFPFPFLSALLSERHVWWNVAYDSSGQLCLSQANYVYKSLGKPSESKGYDAKWHESRLYSSDFSLQAHILGQVIIIQYMMLVRLQCGVTPSLNLYIGALTGDSAMFKQEYIRCSIVCGELHIKSRCECTMTKRVFLYKYFCPTK